MYFMLIKRLTKWAHVHANLHSNGHVNILAHKFNACSHGIFNRGSPPSPEHEHFAYMLASLQYVFMRGPINFNVRTEHGTSQVHANKFEVCSCDFTGGLKPAVPRRSADIFRTCGVCRSRNGVRRGWWWRLLLSWSLGLWRLSPVDHGVAPKRLKG